MTFEQVSKTGKHIKDRDYTQDPEGQIYFDDANEKFYYVLSKHEGLTLKIERTSEE